MRATWITRSFLDYRIPVFQELNTLIGGRLIVLFCGEVVPERVAAKTRAVLGDAAITLDGEWRLTGKKKMGGEFANTGVRIPFQPGLVRAARRSQILRHALTAEHARCSVRRMQSRSGTSSCGRTPSEATRGQDGGMG